MHSNGCVNILPFFFLQIVEDPLQLLRIKCVADEQGDGVLGELIFKLLKVSAS